MRCQVLACISACRGHVEMELWACLEGWNLANLHAASALPGIRHAYQHFRIAPYPRTASGLPQPMLTPCLFWLPAARTNKAL